MVETAPQANDAGSGDMTRIGGSIAAGRPDGLPHVVVLGAGFAGLSAARALARAPVNVTVVDQHNYHLFQPLLYQVATAGLSPPEIAAPIRSILAGQANARVILGKVIGIDKSSRVVELDQGKMVRYDILIVATGARHGYFGNDKWERVAPGLKTIEDAIDIRGRILIAFEKAETTANAQERESLLTFVIVGGGPTGVELAGSIAELARKALARDFRHIDPTSARVVLIEASSRVLQAFPEELSERACLALEKLGVEVMRGRVTECSHDGVLVGDSRIPARTIVWAAGVAASAAGTWLEADTDPSGRVKVSTDLSMPRHPEIFVIGDTALVIGKNGKPIPGIASAAKQQGQYVGAVIRDRLAGKPSRGGFRYRHRGSLATIGRKSAVADFGFVRLSGSLAWFLWGAVHIFFLIGFRNRIAVLLDWLWAYVSFNRSVRLIFKHGAHDHDVEPMADAKNR